MIYAVAFIASLVVLLFLIKKPVRLLYTIVLVPGLVDLLWDYDIFGVSFLDLFYGIFVVVAVFTLFFGSKTGAFKLPQEYGWLFVAFFFPIIIPIINGEYLTGLNLFVKISFGLIAYLLVVKYLKVENREKFVKYLTAGVLISLLVFLYQLISGTGVGYSQYTYGTGFYADEGTLSRKAVYAIILFFPFKGNIFYKYKWIYFPVLFFAFATLGLSVSRTALIAAIVVVLFYAVYKKSLSTSLLLILLIPFLFYSVESINQGFYNKIEKEINYLQGESSVNVETLGSGRIGRWKAAIDDFEDASTTEKIFGTGMGIGPHGQFFDLLKRGGIFSLTIFLFFFGKITVSVYRKLGRLDEEYIPLYLIQFILAFWMFCIGATPLYNFQFLIIIFSLYGLFEKMLLIDRQRRHRERLSRTSKKADRSRLMIPG